MVHQPLTANTLPRQNGDEPSHAREWRWPVGLEIKVNSRHPVMRVVRLQRRVTAEARVTANKCEAWIADIDEVEARFDSKEQIAAYLSGIEQQPRGHVWVLTDHGPIKGWRRFLGLKCVVSPCFTVEWDSDYASLIFLDDVWSEYRAMDVSHPVAPNEEVRRRIAHGEVGPHPTAECMEKARAFAAIRYFLIQGVRPDWLTYNCVR